MEIFQAKTGSSHNFGNNLGQTKNKLWRESVKEIFWLKTYVLKVIFSWTQQSDYWHSCPFLLKIEIIIGLISVLKSLS